MASPAASDVGQLHSENSFTTENGSPLPFDPFKGPAEATASSLHKNEKLLPKVPSHASPVSKPKMPRLETAEQGFGPTATTDFKTENPPLSNTNPSMTGPTAAADNLTDTSLLSLMGGTTAPLSPKEVKRLSSHKVASQSLDSPLMEICKYVLERNYSATNTKLGENNNEALELELLTVKQELLTARQQLLIGEQQHEEELIEKGKLKNQVARLEKKNYELIERYESKINHFAAKFQHLKDQLEIEQNSEDSKSAIQVAMFKVDCFLAAMQSEKESVECLQVKCTHFAAENATDCGVAKEE